MRRCPCRLCRGDGPTDEQIDHNKRALEEHDAYEDERADRLYEEIKDERLS